MIVDVNDDELQILSTCYLAANCMLVFSNLELNGINISPCN